MTNKSWDNIQPPVKRGRRKKIIELDKYGKRVIKPIPSTGYQCKQIAIGFKTKSNRLLDKMIKEWEDVSPNYVPMEDREFLNMNYTEVNEQLTLEQEISQALARGYCHDKNASKVLDADLIFAMVDEVMQIIEKPCKVGETHDEILPLFFLTRQIKDHVENYSQDMQVKIYGPILHYCIKMFSELERINSFILNLNKRSNGALNV